MRYGRSRSFNVIEIGTDRKPIGDFLLVLHCKYMPRYNDLLVENLRFRNFCPAQSKGLPWNLGREVGVPVLLGGDNRVILRSLVLSQYQRATDRQTDGQTYTPPVPMSRSSIAERDKIINKPF